MGKYARLVAALMTDLHDDPPVMMSPQRALKYNGFPSPTFQSSGGYLSHWRAAGSGETYRVEMRENVYVEVRLSEASADVITLASRCHLFPPAPASARHFRQRATESSTRIDCGPLFTISIHISRSSARAEMTSYAPRCPRSSRRRTPSSTRRPSPRSPRTSTTRMSALEARRRTRSCVPCRPVSRRVSSKTSSLSRASPTRAPSVRVYTWGTLSSPCTVSRCRSASRESRRT